MRKRKLATILILICLMITGLCSCGQDKEVTACLDDLKNGLEDRWTLQEPDTLDQRPNYYAECTKAELDSISKYEKTSFEDKEFGKIINDYIGALHSQEDGAQYYFSNPKKFEELYYEEGYDIRSNCLKELCDKYSFDVNSDYKESLDNVLDKSRPDCINLGETVAVKTDSGDINISIDKVEKSNWNKTKDQLGSGIEDGYDVFLLDCTMENISYESDAYTTNPDGSQTPITLIYTNGFMAVEDNNGVLTDPHSIGFDNGSYKSSAGGSIELDQGRKIKIAMPYMMPNDTSHILVDIVSADNKIYELVVEVK